MKRIAITRYLRVPPGRYFKIGNLYVPSDWYPTPRRAKRVYGSAKDPDIPSRRSAFARVWIQILKARGEL